MANKQLKEESQAFDCLAVTACEIFPFATGIGKVKAIASVTLNDQLIVRGLRVMESSVTGLYVGFPSDPFYKGEEFQYLVCPITRQLREHVENCVLEKYQQQTTKTKEEGIACSRTKVM